MDANPSPKAQAWHRMRQFLKAELLQLPASTALRRRKLATAGIACIGLGSCLLMGGVLYVAAHFIAKFW